MTDLNFLVNMSNINNNLAVRPVDASTKKNITKVDESKPQFKDILEEKCKESNILFSKHANERIEERNIDVGDSVKSRLNEAIDQAKVKGLKNVLVMIDSTAFIVSTASNKVITAVNSNDLKENIFTNIDGAVIK